jgi:hypothetical protein
MTRGGDNCTEFHALMRAVGQIAAEKKLPCIIKPGEAELMRRRDEQKEKLLKCTKKICPG